MKTVRLLATSACLSSLLLAAAAVTPACGGASSSPVTPSPSGAAAGADVTAKLRAALADTRRPEKERVRDSARHPTETLAFFGLRDDMTVLELWPGGGWYTALLAPTLRERGKLAITSFDPNGPADQYETKSAKTLKTRLDGAPDLFGKVDVRQVKPPTEMSLGADASVDLVLTFRNFHNWMEDKIDDKLLAAAFKVLKPGGVLGVVEHRAKADADPAAAEKTGYVPEAYVVRRAEAAGFKLDAKSEINGNPKDTKDYPEGVWTLPPALRLKEVDRAKYEAIGESDRMTLRFVKPK